MARPKTKQELIQASNENFEKMWNMIDSMTEQERNTPFDFGESPSRKEAHWKRDKNVRDILVHLYEWHELLLTWVEDNENGKTRPFLPAPYKWNMLASMNVKFWQMHQKTTIEDARVKLLESHKKVMAMIEHYTNEELFEADHFDWTGNSCLGSYCVSDTSSHYEWAMKKLKLHIKMCKAAAKSA